MRLALIIDAPAPGAVNMARDLALLERVEQDGETGAVRIYGFSPPCLSLGRSQSLDDVDLEACARDGVEVARRPTGGRAVLHDGEVTYAVVCAAGDPRLGGSVPESYARIHAVVADALRTLQVPTATAPGAPAPAAGRHPDCFARPAAGELLDSLGRKLVGSAQARRAGALLQHGSILLEPPGAARYLRTAPAGGEPAGGLNQLLGREVQPGEVVDALAAAFARGADVRPSLSSPGRA